MTTTACNVVIVGRDVALWLTAAALGEALGPAGVRILAIELPTKLGPASVYATLPALEALHVKLGLDEAALLRATGGSFTLGWNIFGPGHAPFFLALGAYGAPIDGSEFFPQWVKARRYGLSVALEDFSPTAMAARHGRVLVPDEDMERFGRCDYAYHLPAIRYASALKSRAQTLGVTIHQAIEIDVERQADGMIRSIVPDALEPISGDFFIDASGPEAVLLSGGVDTGVEDWQEYLPTRRVLHARGKALRSVPPYGELRLADRSWTALSASQSATHVVHAHLGENESVEQIAVAAAGAAGTSLQDLAIEEIQPGLRKDVWAANYVAIGGSACVLDPLFDLGLHAVQLGIVHLLALFPTAAGCEAERVEYNRIMRSSFERLRDFQAALYALNGESSVRPRTLDQKVQAFRARGIVAPMEDETFLADQWRALFVGLGVMPDGWPPAIDTASPDRMKDGFRQILGFVRTKVLEQPTHDRYLADIGARSA